MALVFSTESIQVEEESPRASEGRAEVVQRELFMGSDWSVLFWFSSRSALQGRRKVER